MTTANFSALAGPTAKAMHAAQQHRKAGQDVKSTMKCPRCNSTLRFTVFASGVSYGQCVAARCVKWTS